MSIFGIFKRRKCIICGRKISSTAECDPSNYDSNAVSLLKCVLKMGSISSGQECPLCHGKVCVTCAQGDSSPLCPKCGCYTVTSMTELFE